MLLCNYIITDLYKYNFFVGGFFMSGSFCNNCGSSLTPGSSFCNNCGRSQSPSQVYSQPSSSYSPPPQPAYYNTTNYNMSSNKDKPLTVGEYIIAFILLSIPLVGFIIMLVWAFGSEANTNKKNLSRAILIMGVVAAILYGLIMLMIFLIAMIAGGMGF